MYTDLLDLDGTAKLSPCTQHDISGSYSHIITSSRTQSHAQEIDPMVVCQLVDIMRQRWFTH